MKTMDIQLVHRLSRIQGQIEAIKKEIQLEENKDCVKIMRLIKASNNAMKKFGEAYITAHLEECLRNNNSVGETLEKDLKDVINSVFNL
jgi:CsoR family transcriptional regulator, copper-sensing transcriptional repressor